VATTTDYVTNLQDQFLENVRRSQQAVVDAIGVWAESVEKAVPDASARTAGGRLPRADEIVDNTFDFAEKLLGAQRQFAKSVLSVSGSSFKGVQERAETEVERPARKSPGTASR
jgi:hypothetical protein